MSDRLVSYYCKPCLTKCRPMFVVFQADVYAVADPGFLAWGVKNCSEGRHVIAHFKDKFASSFNDSTRRPIFEIMLFLVDQWH